MFKYIIVPLCKDIHSTRYRIVKIICIPTCFLCFTFLQKSFAKIENTRNETIFFPSFHKTYRKHGFWDEKFTYTQMSLWILTHFAFTSLTMITQKAKKKTKEFSICVEKNQTLK